MFKFLKKKQLKILPISGFDIRAFLEANPDVERSLKDKKYKDIYEYLQLDGLRKIENGELCFHKNFVPFNEEKYLTDFPDVKLSVESQGYINGFEHFKIYGYMEIIRNKRSYDTVAFEQKASVPEQRFASLKEAFDAHYYLSLNEDVKNANIDAYEHFLKYGMYEGRAPNIWFDSKMYLETNPDVKSNKIPPFQHYIEHGQYENRKPNNYLSIKNIKMILDKKLFDYNYYLTVNTDVLKAKVNPLFHYISSGFREHRNPRFDFDSYYYMRHYNIETCPLLHWMENQNNKTLPQYGLVLKGCNEYNTKSKVAFQIHLFYMDVIPQIERFINNIPFSFDLLISVMSDADKVYVENYFTNIKNVNKVVVKVVANIGRDISPLLISFKSAWQEYDYLCHIHTKRSLHINWGDKWRTYLFDKLIGNPDIIRESIKYLDDNRNVAILYPENYFHVKKDTENNCNIDEINNVLSNLNLSLEEDYSSYHFAAGTMQWFRTECFKNLIALDFKYDDFKNTNTNLDGTLAHAMERVFSIYAQKEHYDVMAFYSKSNTINVTMEAEQYSLSCNLGDKWMRDNPKISANSYANPMPMHNYYNKDSIVIHWVIPDYGIGAGGHMTIFRIIYFLEKLGHRQTIWIQNARNYLIPQLAKEAIVKHYQPLGENVDVQFLPDDTEWISGDVVFATDCWTAYPVRSMSKFKKRCYFIQDYEPMFHAMGENYLIAEQTYDFGFTAITAGTWLKKKAQDKGMTAYDFPLCADSTVYSDFRSNKYTVEGKVNIAFYSRSYTPRRAVRLGIAGFNELVKNNDNIHVHCFGQDDLPAQPEFEYTNHGILSPDELAELYNSCDIGVVFSATNYSLIPLEMMGCGLPIVELDVESTRYIFSEDCVTFAKPNVPSMSNAVQSLIDNPQKRELQKKAGLDFLQNISWEKAAQNVNDALYQELEKENFKPVDINSITNSGFSSKTHATVVIPTLNASGEIEPLLDILLKQKTSFSFDIIVIDSASDDNTPQMLQEYADKYESVQYIHIERSEFQHGRTRDMGIEKAKGDYVAFLTQDALPYDEHWLEELIKSFGVDEKIVGVFGKHTAYKEHSAFVKRDINNHFHHFDMLPKIYSWDDAMPSHITRGLLEWQMKMMFYSDNNSAICKKAWQSIHYPHIDWGEDQVWAWTIVQLGLKKYYASDAVVYHSHDDDYDTRLKVSGIENDFFYNNFGIKLIESKEQAIQVKQVMDNNDTNFSSENHLKKEELAQQIKLNEATIEGRSAYIIN